MQKCLNITTTDYIISLCQLMPITEELKNVKKFESVGFSPARQMAGGHEQAEALAESLEQALVNGNESLKEFIRSENKTLRLELKADIATTSKDLLIKLFGIIVGTVGIAVTILKLFP